MHGDGIRLSDTDEKQKTNHSKKPKCLETATPNPRKFARMETITDQIKLIQGNKVKAKFKLKKFEDVKNADEKVSLPETDPEYRLIK